jgi:hypothetical protein
MLGNSIITNTAYLTGNPPYSIHWYCKPSQNSLTEVIMREPDGYCCADPKCPPPPKLDPSQGSAQ